METFVYVLSGTTLVMWFLVMTFIYRKLFRRQHRYVKYQNAVKEVELPPLGKEWDYEVKQIQEDDNKLIDVEN